MPGDENDLGALAVEKLTRVLGERAGRHALDQALRELGLTSIASPHELHAVGEHLTKREGMAGAVGGLLCVAAVLRGATPRPRAEEG